MPVTPKRFVAVNGMNATSSTGYTVPNATTAIVKQVTLCNNSVSPATVTINMAAVFITSALTIEARSTVTLDLSVVLLPAETITYLAGTAGAICMSISGVEVT